jgi:hypothetical protein
MAVSVAMITATGSQAAQFQMSGTWKSNRGPQIIIPVFAGAPCSGVFCGMGQVTAAGLNPGQQLTVPQNRFFESGGGVLVPVPGPTVVQLTTMLSAKGPQNNAVFKAGPKGSRPQDFAWCPTATKGVGKLNCLNGHASASGGSHFRPGRIRYTHGTNQFGGIAQVLLKGGGEVTVFIGGTVMMQQMLHNPFGGASVFAPQQGGGAFQNLGSVMLAAGNITLQTMTVAMQGKATTGGVITAPGAIVGMGPPETNYSTGFPFTTGKVQATNPTTGNGRGTTMLTLTGMDIMTGMGGRNIVMVASAITKRIIAGTTYLHLENLNMTLSPLEVPSMSRGAYAVAALLVLATGYALRRRLA